MSEITVHRGLFTDVDLHVEDTGGSGRPVVLIHGWPLSGQAWVKQVPALAAAGHRVITYDRRGFGSSDKPSRGYEYDTLTRDLRSIIEALDLTDVTIVGFSMGGGEVARYFGTFGADRIHSAVFASAVPPYLARTDDNPDGPLDQATADGMESGLKDDRDAFFPQFYSVGDDLRATPQEVDDAVALCRQSDQKAALGCMAAFATTDFRDDLTKVVVPTLVIHGSGDGVVPFEGSGKRTHEAIPGSELHVIEGGPHGVVTTDAEEWNRVVIEFLAK